MQFWAETFREVTKHQTAPYVRCTSSSVEAGPVVVVVMEEEMGDVETHKLWLSSK